MWRRAGAGALVLALTATLAVLGASPAAAAPELRLSPASGPAGTAVTVDGSGFAAADVEIRWATQSGPLLATATGPAFSVTATIPDDAPNSYPVVAVIRDATGVSTSNASFQLTPTATTIPVETTVASTVETTATTAPASSARGGGVDGGADPVMVDTAEPRPQSSPTTAAAGAAPGAAAAGGDPTTTPTRREAQESAASTVSTAPGAPATGPSTGAPAAVRAAPAGDGADRPLGTAPSSQSSGVVRSPGLLVAGLGLALAGLVIMAVRNRHRLRS